MSESTNNVPCLTSQDCNTRSQELGKVFYEGEYSTKGCFSKGSHVFFSLGNEEQMSTPTISGSSRERVWCTTADAAAGDDLTMSMPAEEPLGSVSSELLPNDIELSFTEPNANVDTTLEEGDGQTAVLAWQANEPPSSSTTNDVTEDTTGDESGKPSLKEGTANDPCNSNDGEQWDLLVQAMFGEGINPDTGEQIQVNDENDENFLLNYKLPKPCRANVTATAEDGEDEEDGEVDGDEVDVDVDGETLDAEDVADTGSPPDESPTEPKSFYSCSDTASPSTPPSDATEVIINYDYEFYVPSSASLDEEFLSKFENTVTNDLAGKYGLISCNAKNEGGVRRYLRGLMQDKDVLALASDPVDVTLDTECAVQVSSATCTPIRGYMTMWLPPNSSSTAKEVESEILSYIENGMTNDMYVSDDVVKVAYVGPRDYEEDETIGPDGTTSDSSVTQDGGTADNGEQGGGSVESGNSDSTEAADDNDTPDNTTDGSDVKETNDNDPKSSDLPFTDKNNGSNSDGLVVDASTGSTSSQELASNDDGPLLAIGLSLLFVALAMAVVAALYVRRKKRNRRYFSDGPSDMNNNKSNAARNALTVNTDQPADTADVQLLPSPDKLDMRSVFSSEDGYITEPETENHTFANRDSMNKYGNLYGGSYGNGVTPMKGASVEDQVASNVVRSESEASDTPKNSVQTRVSGLAAMGAASTLVTSYSGLDSMSMQGYSKEEEYSENESQISASDHSSHVGTVEAFTPNGATDADEEGSLSSKEASTFQSDNAWA